MSVDWSRAYILIEDTQTEKWGNTLVKLSRYYDAYYVQTSTIKRELCCATYRVVEIRCQLNFIFLSFRYCEYSYLAYFSSCHSLRVHDKLHNYPLCGIVYFSSGIDTR